jgi:predicted Zn-dependent protease
MKVCCREAKVSTKLQIPSSSKLEMRRTAERLAKEGRHGEACAILEKLAALNPRNPLIWNDLGVQYEAAGQIDKAFAALKRSHRVDPTYPPALYNLGKFTLDLFMIRQKTGLSTQSMLAEAIGFLNANLDRDPDNADGHYCLARARGLNHDEDTARVHMTASLRLRTSLEVPPEWRIEGGKKVKSLW